MASKQLKVIQTSHGLVEGIRKSSIFGMDFFSFTGIPYMKQPLGELRFRNAQPPDAWKTPFDATKDPSSYCQDLPPFASRFGQEDAGIINVYVPDNENQKFLPVIAYIHGGGFFAGSSTYYGPDYILQKEAVVVTFNYRLGPMGFLSLKDPSLGIPGNAGLKDQLMALKWIKNNIANFNGDANNVTLMGESAGAASVHYHMISEASKGLFHKAVLISGCAFNKTWSLGHGCNYAEKLARKAGWNGEGGEGGILKALEHANAYDLMEMSSDEIISDEEIAKFRLFAFLPVVEPYATENCIINKDPIEMAKTAWSKDIPCIIFGTSHEGMLLSIYARRERYMEIFQQSKYFAPLYELNIDVEDEKAARYGNRLRKIYYEYAAPCLQNFELFSKYCGDRHFWFGMENVVKSRLGSKGSGKTYILRFEANTELNIYSKLMPGGSPGAVHGDAGVYLFYMPTTPPPQLNSNGFSIVKSLLNIFSSFSATGNPNAAATNEIEWLNVTSTRSPLPCLNISNHKTEMISLPESETLLIWDTVYKDEKIKFY